MFTRQLRARGRSQVLGDPARSGDLSLKLNRRQQKRPRASLLNYAAAVRRPAVCVLASPPRYQQQWTSTAAPAPAAGCLLLCRRQAPVLSFRWCLAGRDRKEAQGFKTGFLEKSLSMLKLQISFLNFYDH